MMDDAKLELVARVLCGHYDHGSEDDMEPGSWPCTDGYDENNVPWHYRWRDFMTLARKILAALEKSAQ